MCDFQTIRWFYKVIFFSNTDIHSFFVYPKIAHFCDNWTRELVTLITLPFFDLQIPIFSKITRVTSGFINEDTHNFGTFTSSCNSVPNLKGPQMKRFQKKKILSKKFFVIFQCYLNWGYLVGISKPVYSKYKL